jgi:hypothetical protein
MSLPNYACGSSEHLAARRGFLQGLVAGGFALAGGSIGMIQPAAATQLASGGKRVLVVDMQGGLSQLESWDPKPGAATGGPFRAIPTNVPGLHISELLPATAGQMHHLSIIRSVNTSEDDHGLGRYKVLTGHTQSFAVSHPELGAIIAQGLERPESSLPGNLKVVPQGGGGRSKDAGFLGPQFASTTVSGSNMPNWSERPGDLAAEFDEQRRGIRARLDDRFSSRRLAPGAKAYAQTFDKALQLMEGRDAFDISKEPATDHERYGKSEFARQCLLARRLLERDVPCVGLTHSNFDTHNENFNFHLELMTEFDRPFAALIADLADRGLLDQTLVLVLSEFGRTPNINSLSGRDHWSRGWSIVVGGAGVQRGAVIGKTSDNGTEVVDRQVDHRDLHHTILSAVGIDPQSTFEVGGQSVPIADPSGEPIEELLA